MPSTLPSRRSICLFASLILLASCTSAYAQQLGDQQPTPAAIELFNSAWESECTILRENNSTVQNCGHDRLIRNPNLQAWGFTTPLVGLQTETRYNPNKLMQIDATFGDSALFFVFAHESGHHFDLQFHQPHVPWQLVLPPIPGVPPAEVASWNNELRADAWGGCAVKMTGGDLDSVEVLQTITANIKDNPDVPPFRYAQQAIQAGFDACEEGDDEDNTPIKPGCFGPLCKKPSQPKPSTPDDDTTIKPGCFGPLCKN